MRVQFSVDVDVEMNTDEMRAIFEMKKEYDRQKKQERRDRRQERRNERHNNRRGKIVADAPYKEK